MNHVASNSMTLVAYNTEKIYLSIQNGNMIIMSFKSHWADEEYICTGITTFFKILDPKFTSFQAKSITRFHLDHQSVQLNVQLLTILPTCKFCVYELFVSKVQ